eukprot:GHVT01010210.1.p1 GENE.GHVT01010210.1~~GHVT01010210.1.p1  ORF type:complete len:708 (+),score=66.22 GHVT01010210.1:316-2124(+)
MRQGPPCVRTSLHHFRTAPGAEVAPPSGAPLRPTRRRLRRSRQPEREGIFRCSLRHNALKTIARVAAQWLMVAVAKLRQETTRRPPPRPPNVAVPKRGQSDDPLKRLAGLPGGWAHSVGNVSQNKLEAQLGHSKAIGPCPNTFLHPRRQGRTFRSTRHRYQCWVDASSRPQRQCLEKLNPRDFRRLGDFSFASRDGSRSEEPAIGMGLFSSADLEVLARLFCRGYFRFPDVRNNLIALLAVLVPTQQLAKNNFQIHNQSAHPIKKRTGHASAASSIGSTPPTLDWRQSRKAQGEIGRPAFDRNVNRTSTPTHSYSSLSSLSVMGTHSHQRPHCGNSNWSRNSISYTRSSKHSGYSISNSSSNHISNSNANSSSSNNHSTNSISGSSNHSTNSISSSSSNHSSNSNASSSNNSSNSYASSVKHSSNSLSLQRRGCSVPCIDVKKCTSPLVAAPPNLSFVNLWRSFYSCFRMSSLRLHFLGPCSNSFCFYSSFPVSPAAPSHSSPASFDSLPFLFLFSSSFVYLMLNLLADGIWESVVSAAVRTPSEPPRVSSLRSSASFATSHRLLLGLFEGWVDRQQRNPRKLLAIYSKVRSSAAKSKYKMT